MACHRREYVEPTSPGEDLLAQREHGQNLDGSPFIFGLRTNAHNLRPFVFSTTNCFVDGTDKDPSGYYHPNGTYYDNDPQPATISFRTPVNAVTKPKTSTWLHGRNNGMGLKITFTFDSEAGKELLKQIGVENHNNWPKTRNQTAAERNFTEISLGYIQDHKLRERKTLPKQNREDQAVVYEEVTHGHPAARGCAQCKKDNVTCPLLKEGSTYPCELCKRFGEDCVLLIPPKLKAGCQECTKARMVCSYRKSDENHDSPCQRCQVKDKLCLAGPKSGRMRSGPTYPPCKENPEEAFPTIDTSTHEEAGGQTVCSPKVESKKRVSSMEFLESSARKRDKGDGPRRSRLNCRTVKTAASIMGSISENTARHEEDESTPLTEPLVQTSAARNQPSNAFASATGTRRDEPGLSWTATNATNSDIMPTPLSGPLPQTSATDRQAPTTQVIATYFPKPILFTTKCDDGRPCEFCEVPFSMIGCGKFRAEIGNTTPNNPDHIRMCYTCATKRFMIATCIKHHLKNIQYNPFQMTETLDYHKYISFDYPYEAPFDWCSLCLLPAKFRCGSTGGEASDEEWAGCGLRLCEACKMNMQESGKDLDHHIEMWSGLSEDEQIDQGLAPRADIEFLHSKGHMASQFMAEFVLGLGA